MATQGEGAAAEAAHSFYISSPYLGLQKEREQAKQLITRRYHAYRNSYGGSTEPVVETCQADVRRSDHYILILGERYGSRRSDHGGRSVTELEFEAAINSGRTLHAFFLNFVSDCRNGIERDPEAIKALELFRTRVRQRCIPLDCDDKPDGRTGWEVFVEGLTALAASPPERPGDSETAPHTPDQRTYTPADLDRWLEQHGPALEKAFLEIKSVQDRRVHVPLDVRLTPAGVGASGPMLLQPEQLEPMLAEGGSAVLLISGDGGTGKTSLAYRIARWLMEGRPGGIRRLPLLIETALAENETVEDRAAAWLKGQLGDGADGVDVALVEALLRHKRLIPILDHVSELPQEPRQRLLRSLPAGLVIATSRSIDDGYRERPLSRIEPLQIATDRLQSFFLDYLRQQGQGDVLKDDDLMPAQNQLRRIVGDKPVTALLAQMFIDDVIAKRRHGLAASVPELMLSYVARVDIPSDGRMRHRSGLTIDGAMVQRALKVLALASHRQGPDGKSLFQPLVFPRWLAQKALEAEGGMGLATADQRGAVLGYLLDLNLLRHPGADAAELRFPLDPLADYLAALRQLERLEAASAADPEVWGRFLADLETRSEEERERMRGFLLALRDCCREKSEGRALAMPVDAPDRLGRLGFLDPEEERYRLSLQRARKWMWELGVPVASERRDAISKLAAMAASGAEPWERRAVRVVASERLALMLRDGEMPQEERCEAAAVRRAAAEALGLWAAGASATADGQQRTIDALTTQLHSTPVNVLVREESDWDQVDGTLPLLQGAARGLQLAMARDLPLLGDGPGLVEPMLTLRALNEDGALRVRTALVSRVAVWRLPLPEGQHLEMVLVPGGEYTIGSPDGEDGRDVYPRFRQRCEGVDVEARRTVRLESFAMGRFAISQAQWTAVAALPPVERELAGPSFEDRGRWGRHALPGQLPADSVSWFDAREWLERLNRWLPDQWIELGGAGRAPQLALPSESQWEVACRANSDMPFHWGDSLDGSWANVDATYTYGEGRKGAFRQRPTPIGGFGLVNRWGLAEMHGQLFEWCGDRWHPDPLGVGWPEDGLAWDGADPALEGLQDQDYRLLRGGSWLNFPSYCRSAYRYSNSPGTRDSDVGFRVCCLPPGPS